MKNTIHIFLFGVAALPLLSSLAHAQKTPAKATAKGIVPATAPNAFFFRDGDRAVILGDSITEQNMYSTLIESYVLTRFPKWDITFRNSGWGGDTMNLRTRGNLEAGFARDIAPLKPTAITVDFGMNDARAGDGGYEPYLASARTLTSKLKEIGTRVALITPSPEERYKADAPAGSKYNAMLLKYSDGLQGVAKESNVLFVDQIRPMIGTIEAGRRGKVLGETDHPRLIPDGVHPSWPGHLVMATHILRGLNAPSLVSSVEIDAANTTHYKVKAQNATVTPHPVAARGVVGAVTTAPLMFTRLDDALPWPINPEASDLALKIPGFAPLQDLSRYELKIVNLPAQKYEVRIDNVVAGTWTKAELAAGINLSSAPGPILEQGKKLLETIRNKNGVYYDRWRNIQLIGLPTWLRTPGTAATIAAELEKRDAIIASMEADMKTLRQPVAHEWIVAPIENEAAAPTAAAPR